MATAGHDSRGDRVTFEGLNRTVRELRELDEAAGPAVKAMNKQAAELVAATAKERAPVGTSKYDKHPGRLRDSIRTGATLYTSTVRSGGALTPYAPPIHWGWGRRSIRPQPFIYEALDARRAEVFETYDRGIKALVAKTITGTGPDR